MIYFLVGFLLGIIVVVIIQVKVSPLVYAWIHPQAAAIQVSSELTSSQAAESGRPRLYDVWKSKKGDSLIKSVLTNAKKIKQQKKTKRENTAWLNGIIEHLFHRLLSKKQFKTGVLDFMKSRLNDLALTFEGRFVTSATIINADLGTSTPIFSNPKIIDETDEELYLEMNVDYDDEIFVLMEVTTMVGLRFLSKISIRKFRGRMLFGVPSNATAEQTEILEMGEIKCDSEISNYDATAKDTHPNHGLEPVLEKICEEEEGSNSQVIMPTVESSAAPKTEPKKANSKWRFAFTDRPEAEFEIAALISGKNSVNIPSFINFIIYSLIQRYLVFPKEFELHDSLLPVVVFDESEHIKKLPDDVLPSVHTHVNSHVFDYVNLMYEGLCEVCVQSMIKQVVACSNCGLLCHKNCVGKIITLCVDTSAQKSYIEEKQEIENMLKACQFARQKDKRKDFLDLSSKSILDLQESFQMIPEKAFPLFLRKSVSVDSEAYKKKEEQRLSLEVIVCSCINRISGDSAMSVGTFATISMGPLQLRTKKVNSTSHPIWDKNFTFAYSSTFLPQVLRASVYQKSTFGNVDFVGGAYIDISCLGKNVTKLQTYPLTKRDSDEKTGSIKLQFYLSDANPKAIKEINPENSTKNKMTMKTVVKRTVSRMPNMRTAFKELKTNNKEELVTVFNIISSTFKAKFKPVADVFVKHKNDLELHAITNANLDTMTSLLSHFNEIEGHVKTSLDSLSEGDDRLESLFSVLFEYLPNFLKKFNVYKGEFQDLWVHVRDFIEWASDDFKNKEHWTKNQTATTEFFILSIFDELSAPFSYIESISLFADVCVAHSFGSANKIVSMLECHKIGDSVKSINEIKASVYNALIYLRQEEEEVVKNMSPTSSSSKVERDAVDVDSNTSDSPDNTIAKIKSSPFGAASLGSPSSIELLNTLGKKYTSLTNSTTPASSRIELYDSLYHLGIVDYEEDKNIQKNMWLLLYQRNAVLLNEDMFFMDNFSTSLARDLCVDTDECVFQFTYGTSNRVVRFHAASMFDTWYWVTKINNRKIDDMIRNPIQGAAPLLNKAFRELLAPSRDESNQERFDRLFPFSEELLEEFPAELSGTSGSIYVSAHHFCFGGSSFLHGKVRLSFTFAELTNVQVTSHNIRIEANGQSIYWFKIASEFDKMGDLTMQLWEAA